MTTQQDHCARTRDAAPYVLGRLHGRRLDNFARHMRHCEHCADEVELLQSAAEAVPLLAPRHIPSPAQRQPQQQPHQRPQQQPQRRLLRTPVPKPARWAFVALAVLAAVTVVLSRRGADVRYVHIRAGWSGGGAALQLQGDQLELLVTGMPHPAAGEGYQVWVVDRSDGQLAPTRTWLHLNRAGQAGAKLTGDYHDWDGVAVYVEPLHGRHTTESGAVVVADLRKQR